MSDLRLPFWKHYPRDYLADQRHALLSLEQEGALRRLMDHYWVGGGLPSDPAKLARLLHISPDRFKENIWPEIESFFVENGEGMLEHEDLALERQELFERKRKLSEAGRRGAKKTNRKRWGVGDPDGHPDGEGDGHPDGDPDGHPDHHPDGDPAAYTEGRGQKAEGRGRSTGEDGATDTEGTKSHQEER